MRTWIPVVLLLSACGGGENAGADEARRQAELDQKTKPSGSGDKGPAQKMRPPVPGEAKIPCEQLIDLPAFQAALGEKEPLTVKDLSKTDKEAAAVCSIVRGGKRPNEAEQKAILKKDGHLGVLPGDESCNVMAYCYTIEAADRFRAKCVADKGKDPTLREDDSMGSFACVKVVPAGEADLQVFRFFDVDTKCILKVRGGVGMTDNDYTRNCAKTARDTITPEKIAVKL